MWKIAFNPAEIRPDGRYLVQTEVVWRGFFGQRMSKTNVFYTRLWRVKDEMKADVRGQEVTHLLVESLLVENPCR